MKKVIHLTWKNKIIFLSFILFIFLFGAYVGINEYKKGKITIYKKIFISSINNNISISPKFISSQFIEIDKIKLSISNKDLLKLKLIRDKAIIYKHINENHKSVKIPVKVSYNNKSYTAKVSLTGSLLDHVVNNKKWSLRINLREGLLLGMKKFSLLVPYGRGNNLLSEWLNSELTETLGNLKLNYSYNEVFINEKSYGIYALEEHIQNLLKNYNKNSVIFKIEDNKKIKFYKNNDLLETKNSQDKYDEFKKRWEQIKDKEILVTKVFDIKKMAIHYAIADLTNGQHTHHLDNNFFLYNDKTELIEPIAREWESPYFKEDLYDIFYYKYESFGSNETQKFHSIFFENKIFLNEYFNQLYHIANFKFVQKFIDLKKNEITINKKILYNSYPHWDISEDYLNEKINFIKNRLENIKYQKK